MAPIDSTLQRVNTFITLSRDKVPYLSAEKIIRHITSEIKQTNVGFNSIYKSEQIAGSYADDLKISKPDEFDFILRFGFPCSSQMTVTKTAPGYIALQNTAIRKLQPSHVNDILLRLFDQDGFLLKSKVLKWFEELLMTFMRTLPIGPRTNERVLQIQQDKFIISRERNGPAHTLNVTMGHRKFSIDMVVALVLNDTHWVSKRMVEPRICHGKWHAVPKSSHPDIDRNWITSYAEIERPYIKDKNNLKQLIRYFKKLRDTHKLTNLKSYYIKTIFLWQIYDNSPRYWNDSLGNLFIKMFQIIIKQLEMGRLHFFWDNDYNMFSTLSLQQVNDIQLKMKRLYARLETSAATGNSSETVLDILLTADEKKLYNANQWPVDKQMSVVRQPSTPEHNTHQVADKSVSNGSATRASSAGNGTTSENKCNIV